MIYVYFSMKAVFVSFDYKMRRINRYTDKYHSPVLLLFILLFVFLCCLVYVFVLLPGGGEILPMNT